MKNQADTQLLVRDILAAYLHDPNDFLQDDGSYVVSWTTEYDEYGDLVEDPVSEIQAQLPEGWDAAWTGNGNGDEEDFRVYRC